MASAGYLLVDSLIAGTAVAITAWVLSVATTIRHRVGARSMAHERRAVH
jgi:hypothetical protein